MTPFKNNVASAFPEMVIFEPFAETKCVRSLHCKGVTLKCSRRSVCSFINDLVAPVSIKTFSTILPKRSVM